MTDKEEKKVETLVTMHGSYQTTLTKKYQNRKPWQPRNPKQMLSFIPGTITEVMVKEGDQVEEGDILLTFNAMKMLNTLKSPMSGRIGKVSVSAGTIVAKGLLLVEFE